MSVSMSNQRTGLVTKKSSGRHELSDSTFHATYTECYCPHRIPCAEKGTLHSNSRGAEGESERV